MRKLCSPAVLATYEQQLASYPERLLSMLAHKLPRTTQEARGGGGGGWQERECRQGHPGLCRSRTACPQTGTPCSGTSKYEYTPGSSTTPALLSARHAACRVRYLQVHNSCDVITRFRAALLQAACTQPRLSCDPRPRMGTHHSGRRRPDSGTRMKEGPGHTQ